MGIVPASAPSNISAPSYLRAVPSIATSTAVPARNATPQAARLGTPPRQSPAAMTTGTHTIGVMKSTHTGGGYPAMESPRARRLHTGQAVHTPLVTTPLHAWGAQRR